MKKLNKVEWLAISVILFIVFALLTNLWDVFKYPMFVCLVYPIGFSIVMFYNMIKNL